MGREQERPGLEVAKLLMSSRLAMLRPLNTLGARLAQLLQFGRLFRVAAVALAVAGGAANAQYLDPQQMGQQSGATSTGMATGGMGGSGVGAGVGFGMGSMTTSPLGSIFLPGSNGSDWTTSPGFIPVQSQPLKPYVPGEFEIFVNKVVREGNISLAQYQDADQNRSASQPQAPDSAASSAAGNNRNQPTGSQHLIQRFGADLVTAQSGIGQDFSPQVPPDYLISPGDEIVLAIWGSVDANLRLIVNRDGRISIPRVGAVMVSGVRYADLPNVIRRQVEQVFRNFQLSVSLGHLRSIRIYITGFALQPGSYTVSSLSTVVNALMQTGGPSSAGSFRDIELRRNGKIVATFDLYDLLLRGDTSADKVLQAEDVLQIGAVGTQVAVIGSVNRPAIFELKPGENVVDVLRMAAGFDPVADKTRLTVEHLADRESLKVRELTLPADATQQPQNGDIFRAFSLVDPKLPVQRQNKHVRVEGEVLRPGDYILPPNSSINDAIKAGGGLTSAAYIYGTEFDRESVRKTQQENYDRALRDMETDFTRKTAADPTGGQRTNAVSQLIDKLRLVRPSGRIVLQMSPVATSLPDLALEDGDRIYIPTRPTTVGVFGSVFSGGSYLYGGNRSIEDYLRLAGGPTRDSDSSSIFVIRANGTVVSSRQSSGWFGLGSSLSNVAAEPGDTIFVPNEFTTSTFVQNVKDWTQILYQFGLGVAALKTIR